MNVNDLKHRITINELGEPTVITNDNGFEIENWQEYKTIWAAVEYVSGREYYSAATEQKEKTAIFTIRYLTGITDKMQIVFHDEHYNIVFIDNIKYGNKFMEIKAMEVI